MTDLSKLEAAPKKETPQPVAEPPKPTPEPILTTKTLGGLRIESVVESLDYINILVYGPPGVGKTVLAGSASVVSDMSPVIFIDIEGGTLSLAETYPNVEVVRVESWKSMQQVYNDLFKGKHEYRTVVLDSLTEIQKFSMDVIMRDVVRDNPDRDIDVPSKREWGKNIEQIRRLVRGFRDLPMNTVFTALSKTEKNDDSGIVLTNPSLSGKLTFEVAGFVDIVAYYYIKHVGQEQKRLLLTRKTATETAKDRSGKLPAVVQEPTMQEIYKLIRGKES